jgi:hypothetical protein
MSLSGVLEKLVDKSMSFNRMKQRRKAGRSRYANRAYCTKEGIWFNRDQILWKNGVAYCRTCGCKARIRGRREFRKMEALLKGGSF